MATDKINAAGQTRMVGFYGWSNSGKTMLIERVLRELDARGKRAAVIKQSRMEGSLNTPGKDTWRFARAGARPVVFHTQEESVVFLPGTLTLDELVEMITAVDKPDIILVEGARDERVPKIRIGEIDKRPNTTMTYDDDFGALMDFILKGIPA